MGLVVLPGVMSGAERVVGFEDVAVEGGGIMEYAGPGGGVYWNGSDGSGGYTSGGVYFWNTFTDFGGGYTGWTGWAYSTTGDTETAGLGNQYSAYPGAARGGEVYAVTYAPSSFSLPAGYREPRGISVANTTYAGISMRDGDDFAKQFGPGDYFKLTITGLGTSGAETGRAEVFLADFREGTTPGYILDRWEDVDLSGLGSGVAFLEFSLESTDEGEWGINTPAYIAVDNLVLASTPTWAGFDVEADGWVYTGAFLGMVYPAGEYVYVLDTGKYLFLPESAVTTSGAWVYLPKQP